MFGSLYKHITRAIGLFQNHFALVCLLNNNIIKHLSLVWETIKICLQKPTKYSVLYALQKQRTYEFCVFLASEELTIAGMTFTTFDLGGHAQGKIVTQLAHFVLVVTILTSVPIIVTFIWFISNKWPCYKYYSFRLFFFFCQYRKHFLICCLSLPFIAP